jgi:hypothetical protein
MSIIAVLMALLFPTARGVFTGAWEVQCQNNLRQLAELTNSYCTANGGNFPPPCLGSAMPSQYNRGWLYGSATSGGIWSVDEGLFVKQKYLGSKPNLVCPLEIEEWGLVPGPDTGNSDAWKITAERTGEIHKGLRSGVVMSSYAMNARVWVQVGSTWQSRRRGDFSDGHFLFVEEKSSSSVENPITSQCNDGAIEPTAGSDRITDRHRGGGYIACMDSRVIYMNDLDFQATMTPGAAGERLKYWTPY